MKIMCILSISLLLGFFYLPAIVFAGNVEVTDIETKTDKVQTTRGDIDFAIKAKVVNKSTTESVSVKLQAVDKEGFELYSLRLSGRIPIGDYKILTDKRLMPLKDFNNIKEWVVAD